ncbi:MAG: hypothetical protein ABIU29_00765 [Chthoniobacterales bacterium]
MAASDKIALLPAGGNYLALMQKIVSDNVKAPELVNSLWKYFEGRIKCEIIDDDRQPSVIKFTQRVVDEKDISEVHLILRHNDRLEEALIHELLHAELYRRGYPKWYLHAQEEDLWQEGADILNLAEHIIMLPSFLSIGYREERFVGPSKAMSEEGRQVEADLAAMGELLFTPKSFVECISEYLRGRGIEFVVPYHSRIEIRE